MPSDPTTLLAPAVAAFPKYAGVLGALGTLMALDVPPVIPTPPVVPPVLNPTTITLSAGRFLMLDGNGVVSTFDFGDVNSTFNSLRGYNAAHVYDTPGTYIATLTPTGQKPFTTSVTVLADARPVVNVPATADLSSVLAALKVPTVVQLPPGATFDIKLPIALTVDGTSLRAAGAGASPRLRRIAQAGVYGTLIAMGADLSIEGIEFDSDQPLAATTQKVGIYAIEAQGRNLLVRDCIFRNVDDGIHCDPQARGLIVSGCQYTSELRSCGVYLDAMQQAVILGIHAVGSVREHIVRLEGAHNVLVHGSDMDNQDGKETIAIRKGDCVAIMQNSIRAWARISQGIGAQPGTYCTKIVFATNHFAGRFAAGPWVALNPGSQTVWFDGNTFDVDASQGCIAVQAPSTDLIFTKNVQVMAAGTTTCKPLIRPFGNPAFIESGTSSMALPTVAASSSAAKKS